MAGPSFDSDGTLAKVINEVDNKLQGGESSPFSAQAFSRLKERISVYISELVSESITIARRQQADAISATHVEQASMYLVTTRGNRLFRHLGTIGGLLLGGALSVVVKMATEGKLSSTGTYLALGLGVVGAVMITLHIAND